MKSITELTEDVERTYASVNDWISSGVLPLVDIAFPNHVGQYDINAISDMLTLRDRLNSLMKACGIADNHLSYVIELAEKVQ